MLSRSESVTATVTFSIALLGLFAWWYVSEGTLAMHSIKTTKRELFYWAAILLTFALGTAAGDLLAEGTGLGYAVSALLFGSVIALIAIAFLILAMVLFFSERSQRKQKQERKLRQLTKL